MLNSGGDTVAAGTIWILWLCIGRKVVLVQISALWSVGKIYAGILKLDILWSSLGDKYSLVSAELLLISLYRG